MNAPLLCDEVLEFSEKATSHDTVTANGELRFARSCRLVAEGMCAECHYPVCTHHHWARHATHHIAVAA